MFERIKRAVRAFFINPDEEMLPANRTGSPEFRRGANTERGMYQAAEEFFRPRQKDEQFLHIERASHNEPIRTESEEWVRTGNSMEVRRDEAVVLTASDKIVSPKELQIVCNVCQNVEDFEARCEVCSIPLCRIHAKLVNYAERTAVLCPRHARRAMRYFDTWESLDAKSGNPPDAKSAVKGK